MNVLPLFEKQTGLECVACCLVGGFGFGDADGQELKCLNVSVLKG